MRKSHLRLYGPFLAIAIVQALFVIGAPSTSPDRSAITSIGGFGSESGFADDGFAAAPSSPETDLTSPGSPVPASPSNGAGTAAAILGDTATIGSSPAGTTSGNSGSTGTSGSSRNSGASAVTPAAGAPAAGGGPSAPAGSAPAQTQGDTSHCVGDRQFDVLIDNPRCQAKFPAGADNGGATYPGVTAKSIKIAVFSAQANAAVDGVLATQGLATTKEEADEFYKNMQLFMDKRYEKYGRKIELIRFTGDCPTTPPDPAKCKEAARELIKQKPFMIIWQSGLYSSVFDEFSRAGIISIGGWHFANNYFTERRPFRYDVLMDGTRSMEMIGEYYCKKMAGKNATHAGRIIHPSFPSGGARDLVPRKVGITTPEDDANVRNARQLASIINACDGHDPLISTYASDIERAQEQSDTITQRMIQGRVTTIIHIGDLIAPAILLAGYSQQNYYPENLIAGIQLLDYDLVGRLYPKDQMAHAFGIGHLFQPVPLNQSNVARMYRDVGSSAAPCSACALPMGYLTQAINMIHATGPNLHPLTVESTMLNSPPFGGDKIGSQRIEFGPDDYTAISDAREIYWSDAAFSTIDGRPGAWISINDARRYRLGEFSTTFEIPVPPQ